MATTTATAATAAETTADGQNPEASTLGIANVALSLTDLRGRVLLLKGPSASHKSEWSLPASKRQYTTEEAAKVAATCRWHSKLANGSELRGC